MGDSFAGKVVLVGGGGWFGPDDFALGVGAGISQLLARKGAKVAVLDNRPENAERTLKAIKEEGGEAFAVNADMRVDADCKRAVQETIAKYGQLDVLVNNAAIGTVPEGIDPTSIEAWDYIWNTNFRSFIMLSRYAADHLPRGGSIVNIGSVFGAKDPIPGAYAISKRAVSLVATPTLAAEYGPKGIRVNGVTMGYVWNAVTQTALPGLEPGQSIDEWRAMRREHLTAIGVEGDAWDVAEAVAFLASDKAKWITGQDLILDGGYSLIPAFEVLFGNRNRGQGQVQPKANKQVKK